MPSKYLFEVSWEVCNKVGGIHTVITTKLPYVQKEFGDNYYAIGPFIPGFTPQNFTEKAAPDNLQSVFDEAHSRGVELHFGLWETGHTKQTQVILVDFSNMMPQASFFKAKYWEDYGLDSLGSDFFDFDQPLLWSTAIGIFTEIFADKNLQKNDKIALHAHEWMSAGSILYLKHHKVSPERILTIFTTHATALGRALTSRNIYHENQLSISNPDTEARNVGVLAKHLMEKIAGNQADHFTTVSEVTAQECQRLLGVKPVVVENGLDLINFPNFEELIIQKSQSRHILNDYLFAYFAPFYPINLNKVSIHFTMGRYEFHNKGYDLHLEALAELNQKLKSENSEKTLVNIFMVPGDYIALRPEMANQIAIMRQILLEMEQDLHHGNTTPQQYFYGIKYHQKNSGITLTEKIEERIENLITYLPKDSLPPLSPFEMRHNEWDEIMNKAKSLKLTNNQDDRVKIIFLPVYLNGFDGILNLPLYNLIVGCDLGVFASAYEPWGYTPMESLVMGVPAITSTLSGFGQAATKIEQITPEGVLILPRSLDNRDSTIQELVRLISLPLQESPKKWTERKYSAYKAVQYFNWDNIYPKYAKLYEG